MNNQWIVKPTPNRTMVIKARRISASTLSPPLGHHARRQ
jgi:hypothetical protein